MIKIKSIYIAIVITIALVGLFGIFLNTKHADALSAKDENCYKYAKPGPELDCCLSHTSQNFEECFNEPAPAPVPEPEPQPIVEPTPSADVDLNAPQETEETPEKQAVNKKLIGILDPLWGGLARPFDEMVLQLPQVMIGKPHDQNGKEIPLEDLKDWKNKAPIVKLEIPIDKLEKGKSVVANLPEGLPIKEIVFPANESIENTTVDVTITKDTPNLLKAAEKGGGPIDEVKNIKPPDLKKYNLGGYVSIKARQVDKETHPFKNVLFEILPDYFNGLYRVTKMIRFQSKFESWFDLPSVKKDTNCAEGNCEVISWSPGTSYFALVTEKSSASKFTSYLIPGIYYLGGFILLLIAFVLVIILAKKSAGKTAGIVIIICLSLFTIGGCASSVISFFPNPKTVVKPLKHLVTLKTTLGDIQFETFDVDAPKSVSNFITLAESGFYDDNIFHRVVKNFLIQSGDPSGKGNGGPGYIFSEQPNSETKSYQEGSKRGTVALSNEGLWNTNGSQFFIMLIDDNSLRDNYTIIGKVVSGSEVMDKIGNLSTGEGDRPIDPPRIQSVIVEEVK